MQRLPVVAASFALLATALAGCSQQANPNSLYPLAAGLSWTYQVAITRKRGHDSQTQRAFKIVERGYFAGEHNVAIRRNNDGIRYWEAKRDDGFYRIAHKTLADDVPIMDQPAVKILPLPAKVGSTWQEPTQTFLLGNVTTFITSNSTNHTIVLDYRIQSTDANVRVPAGRFAHCVLAVGKTTFHLGASEGVAASNVPIVQREWYCPGVGLTRLTRDEKFTAQQKMLSGGHIDIKLVAGPS